MFTEGGKNFSIFSRLPNFVGQYNGILTNALFILVKGYQKAVGMSITISLPRSLIFGIKRECVYMAPLQIKKMQKQCSLSNHPLLSSLVLDNLSGHQERAFMRSTIPFYWRLRSTHSREVHLGQTLFRCLCSSCFPGTGLIPLQSGYDAHLRISGVAQ